MENYLRSGQVAKLLGVHRNTVSSWERKGILKPHHVAENGYKFYTEQQILEFMDMTTEPQRVKSDNDESCIFEETVEMAPDQRECRALTAEYHYYSTAKPIRKLKEIYLNELVEVAVGRTGSVGIKMWIDRNLQVRLLPTAFNTPEYEIHPTDFDIFIIESVRSLRVAGNDEFTAAQLVRHMHGNSNSGISNEEIKKVEERLKFLMTLFIRLEVSEEFSHYPNIPARLRGLSAIQGHLLDLVLLERKDRNNRVRLYFSAPLNCGRYRMPEPGKDVAITHESYSGTIGKETCYNTRLLDVPGLKKTEEALVLTNYLLQKLQGMRKNKKGIKTILFETIEKDCAMVGFTAKKKCKMRKTVFKVLDNCKEQGRVRNYVVVRKGNRYHSLKVEW